MTGWKRALLFGFGWLFADKLVQENDNDNTGQEKQYRRKKGGVSGNFMHSWQKVCSGIFDFLMFLLCSNETGLPRIFFLNAGIKTRLRNL